MAHGRKTCGELILSSALVLTDFKKLIPKVMEQVSPNAACHFILQHPPEGAKGRKIQELSKAAQALRAILRDYPEEIPYLERLFNLSLK